MKKRFKKTVAGTSLKPWFNKFQSLFKRAQDGLTGSTVTDQNRLYDRQTLEVMKRVLNRHSNCIDIGCHQGSILKVILDCAPQGTHFAFEPLPDMYRDLVDSLGGIKNLHLFDYALSDAAGTASFQHVITNPGYSGFRKRRYDRPNEQIDEITVQTERLDHLVPADVPVHFIKIDVEGAELEVFRGALETIKKNRPVIVFEHGLGAADHYGTKPEDIHDLLVVQCGLRLYLMSLWLNSQGQDALDRTTFCELFYGGSDYYFMAAK